MKFELTEYTAVDAMVSAYRDATGEIRRAFDLLKSAEDRLQASFGVNSCYSFHALDPYGRSTPGPAGAEANIDRIRRNAWRMLLEKLNVRAALSEKRWTEIQKQLERGEVLEISEESIHSMVDGLAGNLSSYFAEAVTEVFEFLRPPGSKYKTNTEYEVGLKVILQVGFPDKWDMKGWWKGYRTNDQRLIGLDNVFHLLDGKARPQGDHYGPLCSAIKSSDTGIGETEYFKFKCFQNGNIHLTFKRSDLVTQLNVIAGGNRLRDPERSAA